MFARMVSFAAEAQQRRGVTQTIEKDIIPLLRKQPGFQDEIASSSQTARKR